ncbi:hypothetical protein WJX84_000189 [Apatococcus fuscideae]|uniref:Uncharacterized protein n=1 Tax=Apatococcus fuscideae TaxID=2026836 RepID=A0AAW1SC36_9CHLO
MQQIAAAGLPAQGGSEAVLPAYAANWQGAPQAQPHWTHPSRQATAHLQPQQEVGAKRSRANTTWMGGEMHVPISDAELQLAGWATGVPARQHEDEQRLFNRACFGLPVAAVQSTGRSKHTDALPHGRCLFHEAKPPLVGCTPLWKPLLVQSEHESVLPDGRCFRAALPASGELRSVQSHHEDTLRALRARRPLPADGKLLAQPSLVLCQEAGAPPTVKDTCHSTEYTESLPADNANPAQPHVPIPQHEGTSFPTSTIDRVTEMLSAGRVPPTEPHTHDPQHVETSSPVQKSCRCLGPHPADGAHMAHPHEDAPQHEGTSLHGPPRCPANEHLPPCAHQAQPHEAAPQHEGTSSHGQPRCPANEHRPTCAHQAQPLEAACQHDSPAPGVNHPSFAAAALLDYSTHHPCGDQAEAVKPPCSLERRGPVSDDQRSHLDQPGAALQQYQPMLSEEIAELVWKAALAEAASWDPASPPPVLQTGESLVHAFLQPQEGLRHAFLQPRLSCKRPSRLNSPDKLVDTSSEQAPVPQPDPARSFIGLGIPGVWTQEA